MRHYLGTQDENASLSILLVIFILWYFEWAAETKLLPRA
jgi:hypothetical protein